MLSCNDWRDGTDVVAEWKMNAIWRRYPGRAAVRSDRLSSQARFRLVGPGAKAWSIFRREEISVVS